MKAKAALLLGAVFLFLFKTEGDDTNRLDIALGGSENVAMIANADSVQAWRTLGSVKQEQFEQRKLIAGDKPDYSPADFYIKSGQPILVSTNLVLKLSQLLLNKDYGLNNGSHKLCDASPVVVFSFSKGNHHVEVFFCFACNIMSVEPVDEEVRIDHNFGLKRIEHDFDDERSAVLQVIKKVFPDDSLLQSLKDKDS
jgi:hypothetical protein